MLQAHGPYRTLDRITNRWGTRARLSLRSLVVIHRTRHISSAAYFGFYKRRTGGSEQEGCSRWCAYGEVERAVGTDGYEAGNRSAREVRCSSGIEFLGAC
jgi:hypothetical protein